jgi:hypothetical protein
MQLVPLHRGGRRRGGLGGGGGGGGQNRAAVTRHNVQLVFLRREDLEKLLVGLDTTFHHVIIVRQNTCNE